MVMGELPGVGVFECDGASRPLVEKLRGAGFTIVAIWCQTLDAALEQGAQMDVPFATNKMDEVLLHRAVGLVVIACSPAHHATVAVKALGIGKHVVCLTPVALNQLQVAKMVYAAQYYPSLVAAVAYGWRFLPCYVKLKALLAEGYIGEVSVITVHMESWGRSRDQGKAGEKAGRGPQWAESVIMGGGVLAVCGSAVCDVITYVTGCRALRAHGVAAKGNFGVHLLV